MAQNETIDGNVLLADGSKVKRRISRTRKLDSGYTVGYISFGGSRVQVEKAPKMRTWTLVSE